MRRNNLSIGLLVWWYVGTLRLPAIIVQLPVMPLDKFVGLAVQFDFGDWKPRYAHIDSLADATDGRYRPEQAEVAS